MHRFGSLQLQPEPPSEGPQKKSPTPASLVALVGQVGVVLLYKHVFAERPRVMHLVDTVFGHQSILP